MFGLIAAMLRDQAAVLQGAGSALRGYELANQQRRQAAAAYEQISRDFEMASGMLSLRNGGTGVTFHEPTAYKCDYCAKMFVPGKLECGCGANQCAAAVRAPYIVVPPPNTEGGE